MKHCTFTVEIDVACEGATMVLECEDPKNIVIETANFGRTDNGETYECFLALFALFKLHGAGVKLMGFSKYSFVCDIDMVDGGTANYRQGIYTPVSSGLILPDATSTHNSYSFTGANMRV